MTIPEYASALAFKRLPKNGPDRVRACVWYSDAFDKGLTHEEALRFISRNFWMMYCYKEQGILDKLGPAIAGVPVEFVGEES